MNGSAKLTALFPLYVVIFFGFVGYSLMITIFTPMIMHNDNGMLLATSSMAARSLILGILLGLYPLGQFLGSPVLGALSDHYGRKKILMITLICSAFFYFLIALALLKQSLSLLMLVSFLAGLSEANIVIAQSAITDIADEQNRNRLFGYIYMSASSAYILGPLVGGKLADPHLLSWFNYATPFWLVFLLILFTLLWVIKSFHEVNASNSNEKINYLVALTSIANVFTDKKIRYYYLLNFLFYLAIFGFFRCYPMYLADEFHMQVSQSSEFIAWVAVPIVIANLWLTGFLSKRFSAKQLTIVSAILTGIFMIIVILPQAVWPLWITLFLTGLALAICLPSCATLLSLAAGNENQGRVMGNNQSVQVLAESLSGVFGGILAMVVVKLSLLVLGIVAVAAGLCLWGHHRSGKVSMGEVF